MKTCAKCGLPKPDTDFGVMTNGRLYSYCKSCKVVQNFSIFPGGYRCRQEELPALTAAAEGNRLIQIYARGKHVKA